MVAGPSDKGVVPALSGEDLVLAAPGLEKLAQIQAASLFSLPSPSLSLENILEVLAWANEQVAQGADGVVVTQGTDTLEETAYLLDLYWRHDEPLILTGAMRSPDSLGADGPANLLCAVAAAAHPASRGRGVMVAMNDILHEARWVRKSNTFSVDAFTSPIAGPVAVIAERLPRFLRGPLARRVLPVPSNTSARVLLLESVLGDGGELLDYLSHSSYGGVVLAAFGCGHISYETRDRIALIAPKLPVIVASRTGSGTTASNTYGYQGSEIDLQDLGCIMAGFLCPRKARLLLWSMLAIGYDLSDIKKEFPLHARVG